MQVMSSGNSKPISDKEQRGDQFGANTAKDIESGKDGVSGDVSVVVKYQLMHCLTFGQIAGPG